MEPITTLSRMVSAETSRLNLTAALGEQYPRGRRRSFQSTAIDVRSGSWLRKNVLGTVQNDFIEAYCGSGATPEAARDDSE